MPRARAIRICARCRKENDSANHAWCGACKSAYMREWRKTHPLNAAHKRRDAARSYANEYRKRGHLTPEPCRICGAAKAEMHHPDHEQPLVVAWLCREHHLAWHAFWRSVSFEAWVFWDKRTRAEANLPEQIVCHETVATAKAS